MEAYHVSTLQTNTALHQVDNLVKVAVTFVKGKQRWKLFGVDLPVRPDQSLVLSGVLKP